MNLPGNHVECGCTKWLPHCSVQTVIVTIRVGIAPDKVLRDWGLASGCRDHECIDIVAVHGRQGPLGYVVLVCGIVAVTLQDHAKTTVFEDRASQGAARAEAALCIAVYGDHSTESEAWWRVLGRVVVGNRSVPDFQEPVEATSISLLVLWVIGGCCSDSPSVVIIVEGLATRDEGNEKGKKSNIEEGYGESHLA